jgi:hypothetical protein
MHRYVRIVTFLIVGGFALRATAAAEPFPRVRAVVKPDDQIAFEVDGVERLRYHHGLQHVRPFWYPLLGPAGRGVTAMTHPHDPHGHGHHTSVWIAHHKVNELGFWNDLSHTRIVHERIERLEDGADDASVTTRNGWLTAEGKKLVTEQRTTRYRPLPDGESIIEIELTFTATEGDVTFGKTSFGFLGVRVDKMMGVNDGGGTIRNAESGVNEKGVFWKSARWVDYAGRVAPETVNGITLMDHPSNPRHPSYYHVRDDGWMGTSFCLYEPYVLKKGESLTLRHALYVHGDRTAQQIESAWEAFAKR